MKNIVFLLLLALSQSVFSYTFEREIHEIQVYTDRVRLNIGNSYGTCGARDGWWGWSTGSDRHKDWLSLALTAQAQSKKITVYDAHGSCAGPGGDTVELEGLFIK